MYVIRTKKTWKEVVGKGLRSNKMVTRLIIVTVNYRLCQRI